MSNTHGSEKRVIRLKPIELAKKQNLPEVNEVNEKKRLEHDLRQAYEELKNIKQKKEILLQETQREIDQKRSYFENEKQEYIEKATEEGYQAGFASGKQESLTNYQHLLDEGNSILLSAKKDYHSIIEQADEKIVEIAVHVAEKIIRQRISDHPESFLSLVAGAIEEIKNQSVISIYLHPDNFEYVLQQKNELIHILDKQADLAIFIDGEAAEGSCLIEHSGGRIDASIDTQLNEVRALLQELVMENRK